VRFVHAAAPVVQRRRIASRGSRVGILAIDIARGQGKFAGNLRPIGHAEHLTESRIGCRQAVRRRRRVRNQPLAAGGELAALGATVDKLAATQRTPRRF
jgi:hypothetical protein